MMANEMEKKLGSEGGAVDLKSRKIWIAPQMTVVSIADLTQSAIALTPADGVNTSTKS